MRIHKLNLKWYVSRRIRKNIVLVVASSILSMGMLVTAVNAAPLTYSADTTVSLTSPTVNFTIRSGSTADTVVVNASSVVVTVSSTTGGSFTITSAVKGLIISPSNSAVSATCNGGTSQIVITQSTGSATYTITPDTTQCVTGGGGGGGGGGGTVVTTTPTPSSTPTPSATPLPSEVILPTPPVPGITGSGIMPPGKVITQYLRKGITSEEVKTLQEILSLDNEIYPEGIVSGFFGSLTERAVMRFQAKHGIEQTGTVGPITRAKISELQGDFIPSGAPPALPAIPDIKDITAGELGKILQSLRFGSRGVAVSVLQEFLAKDSDLYPEGLVTGYFGSLTLKAVQKFQLKYGIVADESDPGYGYVGPKTRAKLNELLEQ